MQKTLYDILEVSPIASNEIIEKAFKVLVKKYHPDMVHGLEKSNAEQKFIQLKKAYDVLSDEKKRAEYDRLLKIQASVRPKTYVPSYKPPVKPPVQNVKPKQEEKPRNNEKARREEKPKKEENFKPVHENKHSDVLNKSLELFIERIKKVYSKVSSSVLKIINWEPVFDDTDDKTVILIRRIIGIILGIFNWAAFSALFEIITGSTFFAIVLGVAFIYFWWKLSKSKIYILLLSSFILYIIYFFVFLGYSKN